MKRLKLAPLTDRELEFIRWRIWEPLRRNQEYRNEYGKLKASLFLDLDDSGETPISLDDARLVKLSDIPKDAVDAFCDKWKLPYHVDPATEFDQLTNPQWLFWNWYAPPAKDYNPPHQPLFDHAAFVDHRSWIVDDKYLKVWIDLEASRNQIESALKKELDEWRLKWKNFYGRKRRRRIDGKAVLIEPPLNNYLELKINLEAPRTTRTRAIEGHIEPEIKIILTKYLSPWTGKKKKISRLSSAWGSCFIVYDMAKYERLPFPIIASKLKIKINTVNKQYHRAKELINPTGEKTEIAVESLEQTCADCPERETCQELCPEMQLYTDQGKKQSGGLSKISPEDISNNQEYENWWKSIAPVPEDRPIPL